MAKSQLKHDSLNELIEFFDTHDMGEYWDEMPEVHFDVNIKRRRHLVEIEEEIVPKLAEIAKSRKLSIELLINSWLKDKISDGLIKRA
ncbi:MAG: CopG family antitoxin [Pseudomonadota bacterium]